MKQKQLIKKAYEACISHDIETLVNLRRIEFEKIIKRKQEGKSFNVKWTVVKI